MALTNTTVMKVALVIALAATLVSGFSAVCASRALAQQGSRLDDVDTRLGALVAGGLAHGPGDRSPSQERWDDLSQRVDRVEARGQREVVTAAPAADPAPDPVPSQAAAARDTGDRVVELERLLGAVTAPDFDWSSGREELARFMQLASGSSVLDEKIAELEAQVESTPMASEPRMALASYYLGKLFTAQGPEQGLWGGRAEKQWNTVRDNDPQHWESRFRIGNSYAFYPDVMGKTDDAIALLTEAREIQERATQAPRHARTYLSLARMHQRKGDRDLARAVLEAGVSFHPQDADLRAALASAR